MQGAQATGNHTCARLTLAGGAGDWEELSAGEIRSGTITIYDNDCKPIAREKFPPSAVPAPAAKSVVCAKPKRAAKPGANDSSARPVKRVKIERVEEQSSGERAEDEEKDEESERGWDSDKQSSYELDESDDDPSYIAVDELVTRLKPLIASARPHAQALCDKLQRYRECGGFADARAHYVLDCLTLTKGERRLASAVECAYKDAFQAAAAEAWAIDHEELYRLSDAVALNVADSPPLPTDEEPTEMDPTRPDLISVEDLLTGTWLTGRTDKSVASGDLKELQERLNAIADAGFHVRAGAFDALSSWPAISPGAWKVAIDIKHRWRIDSDLLDVPLDWQSDPRWASRPSSPRAPVAPLDPTRDPAGSGGVSKAVGDLEPVGDLDAARTSKQPAEQVKELETDLKLIRLAKALGSLPQGEVVHYAARVKKPVMVKHSIVDSAAEKPKRKPKRKPASKRK